MKKDRHAAIREKEQAVLEKLAQEEGIQPLRGGVLRRVLHQGTGEGQVAPRSVVTCHYQGRLLSGRVFDDSRRRGCPDAFRVNELINGFQIALLQMHIGDKWEVYIPSEQGYGARGAGRDIPPHATLVFEIELLAIN